MAEQAISYNSVSKECTLCKISKPLSEFHKAKSRKNGVNSRCKLCRAESTRSYYLANKDKILAASSEYYLKHKDEREEYKREYNKKNADKIKASKAKYYQENREKIELQKKEYYEKNKEHLSAKKREYNKNNFEYMKLKKKEYSERNKEYLSIKRVEYYQANKEIITARMKEYRSSKEGRIAFANARSKYKYNKLNTDDGTLPTQIHTPLTPELQELLDKQDNKCYYCDIELDFNKSRFVHLDHFIPLSKGGTHSIDNVVWSCQSCNLTKTNKVPDQLLLI